MNVPKTEILKAVCDYYKIDISSLFCEGKKNGSALKRQIMIYLMKEDANLSIRQIQEFMLSASGKMQSSTNIYNGYKKLEFQKTLYPETEIEISKIRELYPKNPYSHIQFRNTTTTSLEVNYL